jgi:hypothetical protein
VRLLATDLKLSTAAKQEMTLSAVAERAAINPQLVDDDVAHFLMPSSQEC